MDAILTQKIKQDLEAVIDDAEELLKATASQTGERIEKVRARAQDSLRAARVRLADATAAAGREVRAPRQAASTTRCTSIPTPRRASPPASGC